MELLLLKSLPLNPPPINPLASSIFSNPKPQNLKSLPVGTKILTLLSRHSLFVTTPLSGVPISLNNVKITSRLPIYDDRFLIIFRIKNNLNLYPLIVIILVAFTSGIFYLYFALPPLPFHIPAFYLLFSKSSNSTHTQA
ncbi:hypothetical protein FF1_047141 [Malus domestica]